MSDAYYSFLPHLRLGLAGLIADADPLSAAGSVGTRADFDLKIPVARTPKGGGSTPPYNITRNVKLKGPGDITGINSKAIVKVSPADWVTNFESNYLPYIEFYDEDFPWRYTPAAENGTHANAKLRPWVALVVLEESEFKNNEFNGILPSITLQAYTSAVFPKAEQMWAWAHVHVNEKLGDDNTADTPSVTPTKDAVGKLKTLLGNDPDKAVSRLLCPRKLKPNTGYHAFLIPTFEVGRLAGLGFDPGTVDALMPSWPFSTNSSLTNIAYPVYHQWFFKTGAAGDFETLVRLLKPNAVGADVGKRAVDLQLPGHNLLDYQTADPIIGLEGALAPPTQAPDVWPPATPDIFTENLKDIINLPAEYLDNGYLGIDYPDPIIAPPIYGQWHALKNKVTGDIGTDWLSTANLDPRYRIFAGAGAQVVRTNQEAYMHTAWEQVGQIIEANIKIRKMQLAAQASTAMHVKHLEPLADENLIGISNPIHAKVLIPTVTAFRTIKDSVVPNSMFSAAFRRMTRAEGPLMRNANAVAATTSTVTFATMVQEVNTGAIQIASIPTTPAGQVTLTALSAVTSPGYLSTLPGQSNFTFSAPTAGGAPPLMPVYGGNSLAGQQYLVAATSLATFINAQPIAPVATSPALNTVTVAAEIKTLTQPSSTVLELAQKQISLYTDVAAPATITKLDIILAAPKINVPVYLEMVRESPDWLMPNLNSIGPNSISLLKTNQSYIEAYMLGMNHEMSRELLWREYPTDQRGTYFSHFWDPKNSIGPPAALAPFVKWKPNLDAFQDIKPIHEWKSGGNLSQLGYNRPNSAKPNLLVLTIRGELLRKYPGALVYLQQAAWETKLDSSNNVVIDFEKARTVVTGTEVMPIFFSSLEPDIYFLGFDKDVAEVRGSLTNTAGADPGYFFVFQEQAGEVRFGADEIVPDDDYSSSQIDGTWSGLNWGHLAAHTPSVSFIDLGGSTLLTTFSDPMLPSTPAFRKPVWGRNSADMAHILLQDSVKLYVHAKELIPA